MLPALLWYDLRLLRLGMIGGRPHLDVLVDHLASHLGPIELDKNLDGPRVRPGQGDRLPTNLTARNSRRV
jgi:hypothetical protein